MKFNIKTDSIMDISADIIIIAVNDKNQIINKSKLKPSCTTYLSNIISSKDLLGDVGSILLVHGSKDFERIILCLLYTSPSPRDRQKSRMPSSA